MVSFDTFQTLTKRVIFGIKDHKTIYMFDPFDYLGPKRRKMPDDSWDGIFRDHIHQVLPVDLPALHFSAGTGRDRPQ